MRSTGLQKLMINRTGLKLIPNSRTAFQDLKVSIPTKFSGVASNSQRRGIFRTEQNFTQFVKSFLEMDTTVGFTAVSVRSTLKLFLALYVQWKLHLPTKHTVTNLILDYVLLDV
jgi:hypothetical protein